MQLYLELYILGGRFVKILAIHVTNYTYRLTEVNIVKFCAFYLSIVICNIIVINLIVT